MDKWSAQDRGIIKEMEDPIREGRLEKRRKRRRCISQKDLEKTGSLAKSDGWSNPFWEGLKK